MLDKLKRSIQQAGDIIKEQAFRLGDSAKEKGYHLIEEWIGILPILESYGLEMDSFGTSISINPALEVELKGDHKDFTYDKLQKILDENKANTPLAMVIKTIRTTYKFHESTNCVMDEPLIVKIKVRLSPEISVFIGKPEIF